MNRAERKSRKMVRQKARVSVAEKADLKKGPNPGKCRITRVPNPRVRVVEALAVDLAAVVGLAVVAVLDRVETVAGLVEDSDPALVDPVAVAVLDRVVISALVPAAPVDEVVDLAAARIQEKLSPRR